MDPVRFIGNYSSGKMGYSLANELASRGARVLLVSGPVALTVNHPNIQLIKVTSALEMHREAVNLFPGTDGAIMCAAVADYRPSQQFGQKMKRKSDQLKIELIPNPDIAASLGEIKKEKQVLVGFALETNNELENASAKLKKKQLDFIVLNSLNDPGAGFQSASNKITIIGKDNKMYNFELKSKEEVASDIVDHMETIISL
ncbi:phosphopantothenoylcysteine decarboxylase domain-containing protein [Roseimarinus sediminis]|uniref:phosphopantothenoylcysteine decarboxylase domain-containing protein n=1 Tax=Roseimarinus sediminis TaxID=1610899 RepID=UPI003D1DF682